MRSSSEAKSPMRWSNFTRSFSDFISKLSCSTLSKHPSDSFATPRRTTISHPKQLRRVIPNSPLSPHPIGQLPVELIAYIFDIGSQDDTSFPVIVSHVCREWRDISLNTPSLWRHITLGPNELGCRKRLRRAKAHPLDIKLSSSATESRHNQFHVMNMYAANRYMGMVKPYTHQWRSLDIHFAQYASHLWQVGLANCASPAPQLEEFSLVYRLNDDIQEFSLFDGYAPRLRRVTIDGIRLEWAPSLFTNLTFLDYSHHGFTSGNSAVHDVINILSVSAQLVELRILFPRGRTPRLPATSEAVTTVVNLPQLSRLSLRVDGSDIPFELAHLVTLINAPSLTTLHLTDLRRSHRAFPSIKSFFYVYALPRTLRLISVSHGWYDPRMVQALYQALPRLAHIHVKRTRAPEQVLDLKPPIREVPSRRAKRGSHGPNRYENPHSNLSYSSGRVHS
ncbi:hypothetical protein D9619_007358 [Psilocybe cf. subviscida]|uniref:F-box domain-containing protein n=1 Tax=Psilocybe cf. subviscida TaxID=2480587 RepID=A0A8H5B2Y1_9AGAR|nr:hypothetical protein D9619_007358 [Psilocybe cf. subviscida]